MPRLVVLVSICCFLFFRFFKFTGGDVHNITSKCPLGYFKCNNGECIKLKDRCNEYDDCEDGSDERNCWLFHNDYFFRDVHKILSRSCNQNEYKCNKSNECIPAEKFCDSRKDCLDGSDEYDTCMRFDLNCNNKFRCRDQLQHCILNEWVCDGVKDCYDGSDEKNCRLSKTPSDCKIEKSQYLCENQQCIALSEVCNEKDDCGDGSDEGAGCHTPSNCSSLRCDHECKRTPKESICTCKSGYKLQSDNHTCEDIDECQIYGICDQECVNSPGSYNCVCQKKYKLKSDRKSCLAFSGEATLAFSTKTKIMGMYIPSKVVFPLASNLNRAAGIAMNGREHVYWSDIEEDSETIVRKIPYNNHEVIVTTGLSKISGIAVDWVTENIYFTDEIYNHIGVCNDDGTNCTVLINEITKPTGITLLPIRGKLYWSDESSERRIAEAGMDGKHIRTLVSKNMGWPRSVTIDYPNNRLYWVDSKLQIVESIRLDGTDRRLVLHDIIQKPFSLAVFESTLYWSNQESNTIESCNKFSGKDWRILHRTNDIPYGIHIDHSAVKPNIDNPCKSNPCSQLCMLNENKGYTCACTLDKELNADNHTCQEMKKTQHLLIVAKHAIINYYHRLLGKPRVINVPNLNIGNIMSDPFSGQVIIVSDKTNIIRYDPVSNTFENITKIHKLQMLFEGIAFDYIGNNLYILNKGNRSIEVINVKTQAKTAFYFQEIPTSILLVPEEGKMYVSLKEKEFLLYDNIYEMRMDGLGKKKLFKADVSENVPMYYDRDSKTLFMSNRLHGYILSHSNGVTRILRTGLKWIESLTVAGNNIFWTEMFSNVVYWTDIKITSNHKDIAFRIPKNLKTPFPLVVTLRKDAKQEHGCQKNNGNCSHVCLPSINTSFICACPAELELSSDNRTCIFHKCPKNEYKCSEHNLCIKMEKLCDGIMDCSNGEDETRNCEKNGKHCKKDEFMCTNGKCIKSKDRCNSHFDCTDQSDEENCENLKCKSDEFQCHDGTCILNTKVCNDFPDCPDFSDELFDCKLRIKCAQNEFMCNDHTCFPNEIVCDGEPDCKDGEDEAPERCNPNVNVTRPLSSCGIHEHEYFQCTNGNCISPLLTCDGTDDCQDGSDEKYCINEPNHLVNCTANEYHCVGTNICLPKKLRCNGEIDCPSHDDEVNCSFCYENEFACEHNRECIPESWVCDQKDDCGDNSDEKNCDGDKKIFSESGECNQFKCSVGTCLPYSKVCDGERDCPDGSDENGKCQIACTMKNFCKGVCYKTPLGAVCGCRDGYRLAADAISCEDINECEQDVCSQICRNTMGSYECSCQKGYIIRHDKISCRAVGSMVYITVTDNDIRKISPNLHIVNVLESSLDLSVSGIDVNAAHGFVYLSNDEFGTIKKINIRTMKITTVKIVEHPQALAVDWITDNVYIIDNGRPNMIKVCDLEKQRCATLVKIEDETKAMSLVVDPINKWLFWTQITWQMDQPSSKIYRSDMMGFDMKIIYSHIGFVTGMAIDHIKSKLYWLDSFQKTIESSNLDGSQHSTFLNTNTNHLSSINIYEQSLYWFTGLKGQVENCQLYGKRVCKTLHLGTNNIHKYFTILQISRQPSGKNPCDEEYCDYMCVLKKDNATCICPDGKPINSNSTCTINRNNLKFDISNSISSLRNTRHIGDVYSVTIIVLLVGVLLLCVYFYYQKYRLKSKSPKDFSSSSIHFQNPSYDRSDEVDVILNSVASDLAPGQHEYINPIDDKFLKTAMECSAQKSDQCSKKDEETEKENALIYFAHAK